MYQDQYMLDVLVVSACLMPSWSGNCLAKMLDFYKKKKLGLP